MDDKKYNVDDILSEIKKRKSREKAGFSPKPESDAKRSPGTGDFDFSSFGIEQNTFEPLEGENNAADDFVFDLPDIEDAAPARRTTNPLDFTGHVRSIADKAKMRSGRSMQNEIPPQPLDDFNFSPSGQKDVTTTLPDFSSFKAPDPAVSDHTRILSGLPLEEETAQGSRKRRQEVDDYYSGSYYEGTDDPADNIPESSVVDFSEYNSVKDRRDVATDIAKVKLWLFIRASATALLTFILFYFTLSGKYLSMPMIPALFPEPETMRAYLTACTALAVIIGLINSSAIGGGLVSFFKLRANSDSLSALALLASVAQGVVAIVNPETVNPEAMNLYFCIAALSMLFNALGKMKMISRIQSNFRLISSDRPKKAVMSVESEDFCREFIRDSVSHPTIAYSVKSGFFTDFLGLSYSDKYDVGIHRSVAPVCLAGAFIVAIVSSLLTGEFISAVSSFTAILCISATLSATFVENIPLAKLAKKLLPMGGMVSGNKAVEDFCDTEAIILTENDLFPEGNVQLKGIKSFVQGRVDEAILDAASVICTLEGALSPVFLQMIGGERKILKKVDNIVFENGMGISAWVDSRRVLIGNRKLMQNHGIALPSDPAYAQGFEDGELLYLSNSGEVSAIFSVSYQLDEALAVQLDLLGAQEKLLIVYTSDANITREKIWEIYGYPEDLIRIMPADRHNQYREMAKPQENCVAEIVYTGRASTFAAAITACINARSSILYATVIQLIQIVLGYGLIAFMAFMGAVEMLTIIQMAIYQLFWFAAIFIVQHIKQA